MEYTKDIIFSVKYNEEKDCLELKNSGKFEKIHDLIKRNKAISIITIVSTCLIVWDIILINNFINLLKEI